jgi:hypothetical protein
MHQDATVFSCLKSSGTIQIWIQGCHTAGDHGAYEIGAGKYCFLSDVLFGNRTLKILDVETCAVLYDEFTLTFSTKISGKQIEALNRSIDKKN